jgi:hypothetical protein
MTGPSVMRSLRLVPAGHVASAAVDYEVADQRIRARSVRIICERISPHAQQRMTQPKFLKYSCRLAPSTGNTKSYCFTNTERAVGGGRVPVAIMK